MSKTRQDEFTQLLAEHQSQVFGYIYALVQNFDIAEDLSQQTIVVLWRKFDEFEPGTNFASWACRTAKYVVLNYLRTERRSRVFFSSEFAEQVAEARLASLPEETTARQHALARCIARLAPKDQQMLELCYQREFSVQHAAQQLGRSAKSISNALFRVRRALLKCVQSSLRQEGEQ